MKPAGFLRNISLLLFSIIFSFEMYGQQQVDTIRMFYLGGQSNMDGHGYVRDLPRSLKSDFEKVFIFHGNPVGDENATGGLGIWEKLQPGHGTGFSSDGEVNYHSDRFGIELSFAKRLQELYPGEKIAIIKYSRGGSSIDSLAAGRFGSWEADYQGVTGINQYDHFLATIRNAYSTNDIDGDGNPDYLMPAGIIWMQGESDGAVSEEIALQYYDNLKRLMDLIRSALLTDDLPVVIGKISDSHNDKDGLVWNYGDLVRYAQEKYVRKDHNAAIVRSTESYDYSDRWHYNSEGYIDFGEKFADKIYQLNQ